MLSFTLLAIAINIDPNLFVIGPFTLSWHGLFSAVGVIAGVSIGVRACVDGGANEDGAYNMALWSVAGGIVGARLFHVVDNWAYYAQNPVQIVMLNEGGIAIYGAIVGGVLTGVGYSMLTKLKVSAAADGGAIGLILGQAIGRIGDVINGEHRGLPLDAAWAVIYTHPNTLGDPGIPVHLAVGYELVWDLLIFGLLILMKRRWIGLGVIFWTYLLLYSVGRFWISFYRVDLIIALGLRQAQLVALVGTAASALMLLKMLMIDPVRPVEPPDVPDDDEEPGGDNETVAATS